MNVGSVKSLAVKFPHRDAARIDCDQTALQREQGQPAQTMHFELPAQPLGEALRGLAKQANLQILFEAGLVTGYPAPAIRGQVTPRDALNALLGDSGLEAYEQAPGVIVIRRNLHNTDPVPED